MDHKSYNVRVPKHWVRFALIVGFTALVVAPLSAIATHTFTDVPNNHTFHDNIAWLRDADITRGCNPPANDRYCPNDNVTRGQMAAFIERLATNQVVDAGTLEGMTAEEIVGIAAATATGFQNTSSTNWAAIPNSSVAFTQSSRGAAIVRFTAEATAQSGRAMWVRARIPGIGFGAPGVNFPGIEGGTVLIAETSSLFRTHSLEWVFPDLPVGDFEVIVEWRRDSDVGTAGNITVRNRTTVVQHNLPNTSISIQLASGQDGVEPDQPAESD